MMGLTQEAMYDQKGTDFHILITSKAIPDPLSKYVHYWMENQRNRVQHVRSYLKYPTFRDTCKGTIMRLLKSLFKYRLRERKLSRHLDLLLSQQYLLVEDIASRHCEKQGRTLGGRRNSGPKNCETEGNREGGRVLGWPRVFRSTEHRIDTTQLTHNTPLLAKGFM